MNSPNKQSGRVVVITGVTRGLGRALLPHFVREKLRVIGCGRSAGPIETLRSEFPAPHRFDAVDVRDAKAVAEWGESVIAEFGPPALLLNNAAIVNEPAPIWEVPAEKFDDVVDVNIKGVANVIRAFVPAMVAAKAGVIVNFSSGWGRSTAPEVAAYCATKFAIEGLTQAMAQELPKGMAAVPLNPGIIATDMLHQVWGGAADQFPTAERWAETAAPFLLTLGPRNNGQSLNVRSER